jgi:predicted  nucleic acid-binding Zn-ribbon protein
MSDDQTVPTESDGTAPTASDDAGGATLAATLLGLQAVDTEADQLAHRRQHTPTKAAFEERTRELRDWERRRAALRSEIDALEAEIARDEQRDAELLANKKRLEAQLKTVIAPREAEALMHEITAIDTERDELDVAELAALERESELDDELTAHLATEETVRDASRLADTALAAENADIDTTLDELAARREEFRSAVPAEFLSTYDRKRAAFGVAVAPLVGKQCQGCHLELSPAEIDHVRADAAATGVTDCPECGRLLIV